MEITYDQSKNAKNIQERNISFEEVAEFDFETAKFSIVVRKVWTASLRLIRKILNGLLLS